MREKESRDMRLRDQVKRRKESLVWRWICKEEIVEVAQDNSDSVSLDLAYNVLTWVVLVLT